MSGYRDVLRAPRVTQITAAQLLARLPQGMLTLAILIDIENRSGSYALAGAVVACLSVGQAIAMPTAARIAGSVGVAVTLIATATVNTGVLLTLALSDVGNPFLLLVLGFFVGVSIPPIAPIVRAIYPQLVDPSAVRALFALDTTAQELIWIAGPVITTSLAAAISPAAPLLVSAVVTFTGTLWLLINPPIRAAAPSRRTSAFGKVLTGRAVKLTMVASLGLVSSFMMMEVGVVADLAGHGALAGIALAMAGAGSLTGGLLLGHRRITLRALTALMTIILLGTAAAGIAPNFGWQCVALFAAGFGFAPSMSALYVAASAEAAPGTAPEVFGWLNTAALIGAAGGTALAGTVKDTLGLGTVFVIAALLALIAAVSPAITARSGPIPELD